MGNAESRGRRRSNSRRSHPSPPPPSQPEIDANWYVFPAATPFFYRFSHGPSYYQYPGYYLRRAPPSVKHEKAVTIRNDVNVRKESLRIEPDENNPGKYLVAFTFDATVSGSLTVISFAKEGEDCLLTPMKESLFPPITIEFQRGLSQTFRQPWRTGIDLSMFDEAESSKDDVYPLAIQGRESVPEDEKSTNSQLTLAVFEKDNKGEYHVRVVKQILWVNGMRYELQEIYGIGDSIAGNDPGKECVICLSEPRDTTLLPCRHMCMCNGCAEVLRNQTNRCPICCQPIERFLEIKVSEGSE